jgi:hypothetical protein
MFILYAVVIGLLVGAVLGGRTAGLSEIKLRWAWVFVVGLVIQLVLFSDPVTERIGELGVPIYVGSTLAVALVVAANYRITGMPIVALGAFSNLAAIAANGGYMPASAEAMAALGKTAKTVYSNSALIPNPALPWLTDIFALPGWIPASNVFSVGDVLIGIGVIVVIAAAMRRAPAVATGAPAH